jgi:uncharacterized protein YecE (DUF72 family)
MATKSSLRCPDGLRLWIGTSGFQYPEWKGKFYPEKMPPAQMLAFYSAHFATTEINYTFRRIPAEKTVLNWSAIAPLQFRFSFKAPQRITHFAKLRECAEVLKVFYAAIAVAEEKVGPVLFQLPATFKKDAEVLRAFLADLPLGLKAAFEFRHESWFDPEIFTCLSDANAALCIAENEELTTPSVATADFGYLRLRREDYKGTKIKRWSKWIDQQASKWAEAFVYFKHEEHAVGPKFAKEMQAITGKRD